MEITSHEILFMGRRARFVCPLDVTQRLRAESALREREAGLRRARAMAQLGHVVTRPGGSFESWSENLPQIAGVAPAEMPTSSREWMHRLVHADDRAVFRAKSIEAAVTGARVDVEYRLLRPDGSIVHMRQVIEPIEGAEAPGPTRWFSTLQDVTEQKLAELRVLQINEELEQRVRERTVALTLATAEAEQANRAKSEFLSNMSHELRTPLNAIIGFGQLLSSRDEVLRAPERQAVFVEHIVKAGQHLLTLINEILDLARIEAGKVEVSIEQLPIAELLGECQAMIEPQAAQRSLHLLFPTSCADVWVMADRTRVKQVLLNLLSNAVKYNRERGAIIVECTSTSEGWVRVAVQDTGAGLRPDQVEKLFQPFGRLGQESAGTEGTGIGLVVTKRLIELMGGKIGVQSTPGIGSVFWIELRVGRTLATAVPARAVPAAPPPAGEAPATRGDADDGRATVLCVEDNPASLHLVQEALATRSDVRVLSAGNGRLGVEMARSHVPTVILMDNNMPEMSGREAQAILRGDPRTAGIPIIALSANAMAGAAERGLAAGFFRYLTKPVDVHALLAAVDDALAHAKGHAR